MTTLGKYELHEVLGKGGFGTVYRAVDLTLERVVALKVLHPQLTVDPEFIERFGREARLMAKTEHPNIVGIYEVGEEQGRFFIAMRYLPGGSLLDRLKQGPLPFVDIQRILNQVCAGLQELHRQGFVHRDLKPANILFDANTQAVVTDFGLARAVQMSSSSSSSGTAGTPFYRAPELWRGKPPASPATDVYSLGCILGEMLTGKPLFGGDTPDEVLTKHLMDGPDFGESLLPADAPEGLAALVEKALQRDPAQRYPDAQSFAQIVAGLKQDAGGEKAAGEKAQNQEEENARIKFESRGGRETKEQTYQLAESIMSPPAVRRVLPLWSWILLGVPFLLGLIYFTGRGLTPPAAPTAHPTLSAAALVTEIPTVTLTNTPASTQEPTSLPTYTPKPTTTATVDPSAPPACTEVGQTWVSPADGMTLTCVPAGKFIMGTTDEQIDQLMVANPHLYRPGLEDEQPVHEVYLDAYWIDQTEVTNDQFAQFASSTGYRTEVEKNGWARISINNHQKVLYGANWMHPQGLSSNVDSKNMHPVVLVSWQDATAYCTWAGRELPTEAQWEKAARGTDGRIYPWGNNTPTCKLANIKLDEYACVGNTSIVSSYPEGTSPYGAFDMAGNVSEWVRDWYGLYPPGEQSNPTGPGTGDYRVLRGGSWFYSEYGLRSSNRSSDSPDDAYSYDGYGFRCARSSD